MQVLEYFHQQKKQRGVDEALLRLYEPIIWRAFKVGTGHDPSVFVCLEFVHCQGMSNSTGYYTFDLSDSRIGFKNYLFSLEKGYIIVSFDSGKGSIFFQNH